MTSSPRPKYTVTYIDYRWLVEPIRYLLKLVGEDFEDVRVPWVEFEKGTLEENMKRFPYGKLPYFVERDENGQVVVGLSQSYAIIQYLAKKHNLVGKTIVEQAKCEEYADCVKDILKELEQMFSDDEKVKSQSRTTLLEKSFPRYFPVLEKVLTEQQAKVGKGEFFPLVGDKITWVDLVLAHFSETFEIFMKANANGNEAAATFMNNYPAIKAHQQQVFALDKIKKWIEERPVTEF